MFDTLCYHYFNMETKEVHNLHVQKRKELIKFILEESEYETVSIDYGSDTNGGTFHFFDKTKKSKEKEAAIRNKYDSLIAQK